MMYNSIVLDFLHFALPKFIMYSFDNPSPRYEQLLGFYSLLHTEGVWRRKGEDAIKYSAMETFRGRGVFKHAKTIFKLTHAMSAKTILDFGSGKGAQYSDDVFQNGKRISDSLHQYWNVQNITCYDPAIAIDKSALTHKYDGVIATNVLDLIPEEDLQWQVDQLFGRANKFVFCNVMDYPSQTFLPNGENARVTRKSSIWWRGLFAAANRNHPNVKYCIAFSSQRKDIEGQLISRTGYLHNCQDLPLGRVV